MCFYLYLTNTSIFLTPQNVGFQPRPVWLSFSGMGTQWDNMGRDLMALHGFRESIKVTHSLRPTNIDRAKINDVKLGDIAARRCACFFLFFFLHENLSIFILPHLQKTSAYLEPLGFNMYQHLHKGIQNTLTDPIAAFSAITGIQVCLIVYMQNAGDRSIINRHQCYLLVFYFFQHEATINYWSRS